MNSLKAVAQSAQIKMKEASAAAGHFQAQASQLQGEMEQMKQKIEADIVNSGKLQSEIRELKEEVLKLTKKNSGGKGAANEWQTYYYMLKVSFQKIVDNYIG
jgi:hypothetical protein